MLRIGEDSESREPCRGGDLPRVTPKETKLNRINEGGTMAPKNMFHFHVSYLGGPRGGGVKLSSPLERRDIQV